MMWTPTLYYTFTSQDDFEALIPVDWDGALESHTRFIHVSGQQFLPMETPEEEPKPRDGWFVEARFVGEPPDAWDDYLFKGEVKNPRVVIAGAEDGEG